MPMLNPRMAAIWACVAHSRSHFQISLPNPDGTYGIGAMFDFKCVAYSGTH